ncbi:hypothetical protein DV738_g420, partial [Chaetothyriales sp. CBS 135597]
MLRVRLLDEYNQADIALMHKRVQDLWLETYDSELMKTALEVVTGRVISSATTTTEKGGDVSRLKKRLKLFIEVFLIRNEDAVADDHGKASSSSPLMLIKVLDLAKTRPGLSTTARRPLFLATSPYKTSSAVLQALVRMLNPSAGDPVRALAHLGYTVAHEQHALEEYDYTITNLAVDLRDGVRLARLIVLATEWPLSQQLKVPCNGRAAKLFNVQISLTALAGVKALEPVLSDISADDIVDGFREKTMKLLWALTSKWGLEGLLDWHDVRGEIVRLGRAAGNVGYHSGFARRRHAGSRRRYARHKALLQEWAKSVASLHGLKVRNLTTSFADGRVFEAIVDHYTPYLPSGGSETRTQMPLSERLKALGCGDQFAQLFATGPGAAGKHHIFDRDFTLASLAFLCSRLLGPSKTARAATVLQRAWRSRMEVVSKQRKAVLQRLAHDCADARVLSVSAGAEVTGPAHMIEIVRTRTTSSSRPRSESHYSQSRSVSRRSSRDRDDRDYRLRDPDASYAARSQSHSREMRRDSEQRPSSYRSERFLSVPGSLPPERTATPRSTLSGWDSDQRRSRDGDRDSGASSGGGRRRLSSYTSRPSELDLDLDLASPQAPPFRYRPLSPDVRQAIRVLRVRPELVTVDDQALIACDLEHSSIGQTSYSTVSYAWGDPDDPTRPILVDGCAFSVRRNLYELLRHLRKFHAGKAIWIDAITINQADLDEKSSQVQMMSKIYAGTSEVLVWLGRRVDHVGHTIRCMQEYEHMTDYAMAMRISRDETFWRGFRAINTALYWNRVWVIQEFVTPRTGRIIQGDHWVSFGCFQQTIRLFDTRVWRWGLKPTVFWGRRADDFSEYISNIHPLWQRRIVRAQAQSQGHRRVVDAQWALLSGRRYCQDIRDRVYGIMPLATHGSTLRVDYHLNPFEVLLESIWLEHDSHMDRTDVLMNLANILLLTPASVCIYAQKKTSRADSHLKHTRLPHDRRRTEQLHIRAAASPAFQADWIRAATTGRDTSSDNSTTWHNFAVDQRFKLPKHALRFPSRRQCPWNIGGGGGSSSSPGRPRSNDSTSSSDFMTEDAFIHANKKKALALGVYRTTCAPYPLTIYYALTDQLEDTNRAGHNSAMFGGALQGLDLDGLDI